MTVPVPFLSPSPDLLRAFRQLHRLELQYFLSADGAIPSTGINPTTLVLYGEILAVVTGIKPCVAGWFGGCGEDQEDYELAWRSRQKIADGWIRQCWQPWKDFVAANDEHRNACELNSFLHTLRLERIQHDCNTDTGVFFRGDLVIYHPSHSLNEHVCHTFVLNDDEKKGIVHINEVAFQEALGYPWALQETDSMIEVGYFEVIGKALQVITTYACDENKLDLVREHFDKWRRVWSECGSRLALECRRL